MHFYNLFINMKCIEHATLLLVSSWFYKDLFLLEAQYKEVGYLQPRGKAQGIYVSGLIFKTAQIQFLNIPLLSLASECRIARITVYIYTAPHHDLKSISHPLCHHPMRICLKGEPISA
jgi:hypothetical protein